MGVPSFRLLERVVRAAMLRSAGHDWEVVAEAVGCRPETLRRWPDRYPRFWAKGIRDARAERERVILREAELALRELLRSRTRRHRVEAVLQNEDNETDASASSGQPITFGWTSTGKHLAVVWDEAGDDPRMVYPITAYETPPRAG